MALPAILAAGAVLQIYSNYMGNKSQAEAEIKNAEFYRVQGEFARKVQSREAALSKEKYSSILGTQKTQYAKSGVALNVGSSINTVAATLSASLNELTAIKEKGDLESSIAFLRAGQAEGVARDLRNPLYNLTQASGTALTAYASYAASNPGSSSSGSKPVAQVGYSAPLKVK